jgi:hypothetical protein
MFFGNDEILLSHKARHKKFQARAGNNYKRSRNSRSATNRTTGPQKQHLHNITTPRKKKKQQLSNKAISRIP